MDHRQRAESEFRATTKALFDEHDIGLLTTQAVARLFDVSEGTVRMDRSRGLLRTAFEVNLASGRPVPLVSFGDAIEHYGDRGKAVDEVVRAELSATGHPFWIANTDSRGGQAWWVMHVRPFVSFVEIGVEA